jgi:hypothetical protein
MSYVENPKTIGSNIVCCHPQGKPCPIGCNQCFANAPGICYVPMTQPNIPDPVWVGDRIVRMNDLGDSNISRELVIQTSAQYRHAFFNTSVPRLDFPGPVVLTANPKEEAKETWTDLCEIPRNLMAIRLRVSPSNASALCDYICEWEQADVPILLSYMRYRDSRAVATMLLRGTPKIGCLADDYVCRRHIVNAWYQPSDGLVDKMRTVLCIQHSRNVYTCGRQVCKDCHQCESLYFLARRRMENVKTNS